MSPLRKLTGFVAGLAIVVGAVAGPTAPSRTVEAQAIEREMFVSVLDEQGVPVPDLGVSEFIVREDGGQREVLRVSRATAPIQLAILVDTSRAAIPTIRDIRNGLRTFVEAMSGGNEISLITFGGLPRILVEATRDLEKLNAGVDQVFAYSDTAAYLLDALTETVRGFQKREASRPAVVVVTTEGIDFSNRIYTDVLEILGESGVAMHALVLLSRREPFSQSTTLSPEELRHYTENRDFVLALGPEATGGRRSDLLTSLDVERQLTAVAAELSNQYLVVYVRPRTLIPPERIEVSVRRADLTARGTPANVARGR